MKQKRNTDVCVELADVHENVRPFQSVDDALGAMVDLLDQFVPLRLWMVTRVEENDWAVIHAKDRENTVTTGTIFRWSDSICSRMLSGQGPSYAEDAQSIKAYRDAPVSRSYPVGAYVGLPLIRDDGTFIGTLCGVDPERIETLTPQQKHLIETVTRSMSTLLSSYLRAEESRQLAVISQKATETDSLTKIGNRRAWEQALNSEEQALRALGQNAMVLMLDLDSLKETNDALGHDAGDAMLRKAAKVLRQHFRGKDVICRVGGDEFGVMVRGVAAESLSEVRNRICSALASAYVPASVGCAMRLAHSTLNDTVKAAEAAMYEDKRARKALV